VTLVPDPLAGWPGTWRAPAPRADRRVLHPEHGDADPDGDAAQAGRTSEEAADVSVDVDGKEREGE
jgi:hypothetical protein